MDQPNPFTPPSAEPEKLYAKCPACGGICGLRRPVVRLRFNCESCDQELRVGFPEFLNRTFFLANLAFLMISFCFSIYRDTFFPFFAYAIGISLIGASGFRNARFFCGSVREVVKPSEQKKFRVFVMMAFAIAVIVICCLPIWNGHANIDGRGYHRHPIWDSHEH